MSLPRATRVLFLAAVIAASLLSPSAVGAQSRDEVDRTEGVRDDALSRLIASNDAVDSALEEFHAVHAELEDLIWRTATLEERIREREGETSQMRETARTLVLEAYMSGSGDLFAVAFEAGSIQDVITTQDLIDRATRFEVSSLDTLEATRREMERLKGDLQTDQVRVAELQSQAESLVERMDELQRDAAVAFEEADDAAKAALRKYNEEKRRQEALELARRQGAAAGVSNSVTPGFVCPAPGSRFINDWGFPRSGGRKHKGTDMMAPRGTKVLAVGDGTVRLKTNSLGGIVAFLKADHGVTYYYAHLDGYASGLSTGDRVSSGQLIGYVGDSGNALGGATHLHFEVHPGGGAAVNPYPTLSAAC
ncbi:MAG: peptidoglycan DD-metalloendopeptidase family protein [Acidimicrobiia bacterium]|nr:peptidoglycan DD-metalloendopeptidase family protein [Acidimicrobiia bacterium]NNC75212.1 peptidoglycan DD-metalloendopeptidase family protein [Acidimicrobiia bacterium]